jgi:diguanylate cyclase (GGDEF)-like protein
MNPPRKISSYLLLFVSILASYLLGVSPIEPSIKFALLFLIVISSFGLLSLLQGLATVDEGSGAEDDLAPRVLEVLGESEVAMASSMSVADAFRLIIARLRSATGFRGAALWLPNGEANELSVAETEGEHKELLTNAKTKVGLGLAGRAWENSRIETGYETAGHIPAVAIPLKRDEDRVAVLELLFEPSHDLVSIDRGVYGLISEPAGTVIAAAIAFEKNSKSALIDELTGLPNERAFYLLLEQNVAESIRRIHERPLTVLAISVRDLSGINLAYGAAAGNRILLAVSKILKDKLRDMDSICRTNGDEFLVVLPGADRGIAAEIVARLQASLYSRKVEAVPGELIEVSINVGFAHLGDDGDTAEALIRASRNYRDARLITPSNNVYSFPGIISPG